MKKEVETSGANIIQGSLTKSKEETRAQEESPH